MPLYQCLCINQLLYFFLQKHLNTLKLEPRHRYARTIIEDVIRVVFVHELTTYYCGIIFENPLSHTFC